MIDIRNNLAALITPREKEVLLQISMGQTTNEIAASLYLSAHTILTYRKNLLIKMEARNTAGLVRKGFESGLLSLRNTASAS